MGGIVSPSPHQINKLDPLTPRTSESDLFGHRVFTEVIKVKVIRVDPSPI